MENKSSIRLLRHATLLMAINNRRLLIDPMLSPKGGLDPVQNAGNDVRIPMVDLPVGHAALTQILQDTDAVVVTHLHRDHWDAVAQHLIDKTKLILCQPDDDEKIREQGFRNVQVVDSTFVWEGITISRTNGQHGTGEIGKLMGHVSGFVFSHEQDVIYIAGDTIWCDDVEQALTTFDPTVTVVNAGGAKFLTGDPITMTPTDIMQVYEKLPSTKIIAVHMDTVNHCFVKRTDLYQALLEKDLHTKILIPQNGEEIML